MGSRDDYNFLQQQLQKEGLDAAHPPEKRGRGRPKGSKNKPKNLPAAYNNDLWRSRLHRIDPETGIVVTNNSQNGVIMARMGDEKVTAFVQYHVEMMQMRQGVDKKNVPDLYQRFYNYLSYCCEHGIIPNNMNAYFAIGVTRMDISEWKLGKKGTPEHQQFAIDVTQFFESIHEQGAIDGILNPISSIFWQKAHDGLSDQPRVEVSISDPLGEKRSAEDIKKQYSGLPD